ncbi:MAG: DUF1178 family protein [Alphaproteobacteria bacterium]
MIVFDIDCSQGHRFEAWFRDGATFDRQAADGEVTCPVCGDTHVAKAPMAPRIGRRTSSAGEERQAALAAAVKETLGELRRTVEATCENVGERFAEEARRIHYGEAEKRSIFGEASVEEARELADEGVEFASLPWSRRES